MVSLKRWADFSHFVWCVQASSWSHLATLAYSASVCVAQKIKRGRLLNLLTFLSDTKGPTKEGRERQRATPFIMYPFSSPDGVLLLKIWSPERASGTHFSLKDGPGPACLRVSKHQPRALKHHRQKRKKGKDTFIWCKDYYRSTPALLFCNSTLNLKSSCN